MKKAVSIIVICGLLLSIGTVSVFAMDQPIQTGNVTYDLYTDSSDSTKMLCSIQWTACRPYAIYTTYTNENNLAATQDTTSTVCQDFIFLIRFTNRTTKNLFCNYSNCTINIPIAKVSNTSGPSFTPYGSSYSEFSGNLFSNFRLSSNGNTFTFSWHPDFQYGL